MDLRELERMGGRAVVRGDLERALERLEVVDDVEGLRARHVQVMDGWIPWGVNDGGVSSDDEAGAS